MKPNKIFIAVCVCVVAAIATWFGLKSNIGKATGDYARINEKSALEDFDLGNGENYFSKLHPNAENILLFWSSDCSHCENLIEKIEVSDKKKLLKQHLFTVSEDETIEQAELHKDKFPIFLDFDQKIFNKLGLEHIPTVFIVSGTGQILGSAEGEKACTQLLQDYIKHNT